MWDRSMASQLMMVIINDDDDGGDGPVVVFNASAAKADDDEDVSFLHVSLPTSLYPDWQEKPSSKQENTPTGHMVHIPSLEP
mmetsp:Transcript_4352/g.8659  ORF Transcript_4352/g.8659 Transcript_4352/m.8659 type:complete len:82 (-) Transcript_4352:672-917(-)